MQARTRVQAWVLHEIAPELCFGPHATLFFSGTDGRLHKIQLTRTFPMLAPRLYALNRENITGLNRMRYQSELTCLSVLARWTPRAVPGVPL
jgi:hypothetical protein